MNHPHGMAIDDHQQLWVTENDFRPKRVSVWTVEGTLVRSFYGPGRYGGGGTLDPRDKTRFYYDGIEFKLDWTTGANEPATIFFREGQDQTASQLRSGPPETPIYVDGRQYMTNCYNSNPTGGHAIATVWLMKDGVAVPVASCGRANDWSLLSKGDAFKPRWPAGVDPAGGDRSKHSALFVWADVNGDARVQPDEVTMTKATTGGVTVGADLSFLIARMDESATRLASRRFTPQGIPLYDLSAAETLATGTRAPASSGGDQALLSSDGWTVLTVASRPFEREGFAGVRSGVPLWSYPSLWPGLHASHEAPVPSQPGEVIGSTRLLGGFVTPRGGDAGPLWCINGNMGNAYLFTADGLFVAQLFQDARVGKPWSMPSAQRNMPLNDVTLHDENFFPTITQTADGQVYLCDGARTSLVRVERLGRYPPHPRNRTANICQKSDCRRSLARRCRGPPPGRPRHRHARRLDAHPAASRRRQARRLAQRRLGRHRSPRHRRQLQQRQQTLRRDRSRRGRGRSSLRRLPHPGPRPPQELRPDAQRPVQDRRLPRPDDRRRPRRRRPEAHPPRRRRPAAARHAGGRQDGGADIPRCRPGHARARAVLLAVAHDHDRPGR
jgi:hypothetical protein